ncbi:phage baseplate protein [Serratia liquefaciens]|uniref:phage baseplate protein n=1 Tax=Serratia liquefaciens TaxID=614 RepID=UPI00390653E3
MMFSLNQATVLNAVRGGGLLSVVNSVLAPGYGIYYASGANKSTKPFSPASFVVIEVGGEASIATAPVEKGGYTSFNKVQRPAELHITFTVEGWTGFSGAIPNLTNLTLTSRSDVLATLETMRTTADVYDIETPDKTYSSYDLTKYDYRIRSDSGPTLLTVTAVFQDVQDVAEVSVSSETSQADTTNNNVAIGTCVKTENVTASTNGPTLSDVKKAQSGIPPAFQRVTEATSSAVDDVSKSLGAVIVSPTQKLNSAVNVLSGSLT